MGKLGFDRFGWAGLGALSGLIVLAGATPALAGLEICNRGDRGSVRVAIAYPTGGKNWKTEGWLTLKDGECSTVLDGNLGNRYYYYFATTEQGYAWKGNARFCVSNRQFAFINAAQECQGLNSYWENFRELDTGRHSTDYRLNLE
jgi:uncharacterized membrane protein